MNQAKNLIEIRSVLLSRKPYYKGYALSILAALCASIYFVPYKKAVETVSPEVFTLGIFFFSFFMQLTPLIFNRNIFRFNKRVVWFSLFFALISILANYACGVALESINSPLAVVILRTQVLVVMLIGWILFKEEISRYIIIGSIFSMVGVLISSYTTQGWQVYRWVGILWILISMVAFASIHIFVKHAVKTQDPVTLNLLRMLFSVIILSSIPGRLAAFFSLSYFEWSLILISSVFGPLLSRTLGMVALQYIPVSKFIIFTLLTPVFTMVLSWIFLNNLPSVYEICGGIVVITGILIPLLKKVFNSATLPR